MVDKTDGSDSLFSPTDGAKHGKDTEKVSLNVQNENPKALPKMLAGAVCRQWVKCGKSNCRCAHGQPHGPYHYRFFRQGGKLRKRYVNPANVNKVRAQCETRRQHRRQLSASHDEWRRLAGAVRQVEQP